MAGQLFARALPALTEFSSPRAWAFGLLGIHEYLRRLGGDSLVNQARETLTARLMELYDRHAHADWHWFEEELSYDNARLSHALIVSGRATGQEAVLKRGLETLRWLTEQQTTEKGYLRPIGSNGFYHRGGARANFDQQPIEAQATVAACLEAYRATGGSALVRAGATRLRLVHRGQRSWPRALRPRDRRLPRWIAHRPGERKPGSRVHAGLSAVAGGDAPGAEHADQLQAAHHGRGLPSPACLRTLERDSPKCTGRARLCGLFCKETDKQRKRFRACDPLIPAVVYARQEMGPQWEMGLHWQFL